jgi:hypothetical protein
LQSQGFKSLLFNNFANFRIFLNLHPNKLWNKKIKNKQTKKNLTIRAIYFFVPQLIWMQIQKYPKISKIVEQQTFKPLALQF